jgi:hypothetical protein
MGVVATLVDAAGGQLRGLPDPAGGTFDAAGDFDRFLTDPFQELSSLREVDFYGNTAFTRLHMDGILSDLEVLETAGVTATERRGLERLRVMAEICRDGEGLSISFQGD